MTSRSTRIGATTERIQKYIHVSYAAYANQTSAEAAATKRRMPESLDQRRRVQMHNATAGTNAPPGTLAMMANGMNSISNIALSPSLRDLEELLPNSFRPRQGLSAMRAYYFAVRRAKPADQQNCVAVRIRTWMISVLLDVPRLGKHLCRLISGRNVVHAQRFATIARRDAMRRGSATGRRRVRPPRAAARWRRGDRARCARPLPAADRPRHIPCCPCCRTT